MNLFADKAQRAGAADHELTVTLQKNPLQKKKILDGISWFADTHAVRNAPQGANLVAVQGLPDLPKSRGLKAHDRLTFCVLFESRV